MPDAAFPVLTWDQESLIQQSIDDVLAALSPRDSAVIEVGQLTTLFALASDKSFSVASLLLAITGHLDQFALSTADILDGQFETEPEYALGQLPLQLEHLLVYTGNHQNGYSGLFPVTIPAGARLLGHSNTESNFACNPADRRDTLLQYDWRRDPLTASFGLATLSRDVFGDADARAFTGRWLAPLSTWARDRVVPPPAADVDLLTCDILAFGNLAIRFWCTLSHMVHGGTAPVLGERTTQVAALLSGADPATLLALLLVTARRIAVFEVQIPSDRRPLSERLDALTSFRFPPE
jgi:hypothetical protein